MKVVFPQPSPETLTEFIIENNQIEHVPLLFDDIEQTRTKKSYNPYVAGHLSALKWGLDNCTKDTRWPADHPVQWSDTPTADKNLYWLRTLHEKLNKPISQYADRIAADVIAPGDCGNYRLNTKVVGLGRPLPKPFAIPTLLHDWYRELGEYHLKMRDRLRKPSMKDVTELARAAQTFHIKLCCIAPFQKGNGITARLFENFLRLRWGLPWRVQHANKTLDYVNQIMAFEDSAAWQQYLHSVNANERPK